MLEISFKGTAGGLVKYLKGIAECPCGGRGWYNVMDGECVSAVSCSCMDFKVEKEYKDFLYFTPWRRVFKKLFKSKKIY